MKVVLFKASVQLESQEILRVRSGGRKLPQRRWLGIITCDFLNVSQVNLSS